MGNPDHDRRDAVSCNTRVLDEVNRRGSWFHARKTRPIWVKIVENDQTVQTLEGEVQIAAGDLLCRGVGGELWPQKPAAVAKKYSPTDDVDADGWRKHIPQPDAEGCPQQDAHEIVAHACQKYSGRVGRSAAAKQLEPQAIRLAVIAHIRHKYTQYDRLLARYDDRYLARSQVQGRIEQVLIRWERPSKG